MTTCGFSVAAATAAGGTKCPSDSPFGFVIGIKHRSPLMRIASLINSTSAASFSSGVQDRMQSITLLGDAMVLDAIASSFALEWLLL